MICKIQTAGETAKEKYMATPKKKQHAKMFNSVTKELMRLQELADSPSNSREAGCARETIAAFAAQLGWAGLLETLYNIGMIAVRQEQAANEKRRQAVEPKKRRAA